VHYELTKVLWVTTALLAGGIVGASFGAVQNAALRRNQKLQQTGKLPGSWIMMPGSMRRVAFLMIALALVQLVCPLLFSNGVQWWVSAGVVCGYAYILVSQLRESLARNR